MTPEIMKEIKVNRISQNITLKLEKDTPNFDIILNALRTIVSANGYDVEGKIVSFNISSESRSWSENERDCDQINIRLETLKENRLIQIDYQP